MAHNVLGGGGLTESVPANLAPPTLPPRTTSEQTNSRVAFRFGSEGAEGMKKQNTQVKLEEVIRQKKVAARGNIHTHTQACLPAKWRREQHYY